jgi:hypothetical protein
MLLGTLLLAGCGEKIKAGQVKIDTASLSKLQEGVNEGHQPWRTDPLEVARADGADYGFDTKLDTFALMDSSSSAGTATVRAQHKGKSYLIKLVQPFPYGLDGKTRTGNIWAIKEVAVEKKWEGTEER